MQLRASTSMVDHERVEHLGLRSGGVNRAGSQRLVWLRFRGQGTQILGELGEDQPQLCGILAQRGLGETTLSNENPEVPGHVAGTLDGGRPAHQFGVQGGAQPEPYPLA